MTKSDSTTTADNTVRNDHPDGCNPLLQTWTARFEMPPFSDIKPAHFTPAFTSALSENLTKIETIANQTTAPTFANTVVALEKSGLGIERVARVFFNLAGSNTNDALQAIEREMAPILADHQSKMYHNGRLFQRIDAVFEMRAQLGLPPQDDRLLTETHKNFVRSGARLNDNNKKRVAKIFSRLALLATQFSQNVLKDEQSWHLMLHEDRELSGLPKGALDAARQAAEDLGHESGHAVTLARSSVETFLQFSERRDLRETAYRAWIDRGAQSGSTDNRGILKEIVSLRAELASIMGHPNYAAYAIEDQMAKTPEAVRELLDAVWKPALARSGEECDALQKIVKHEGGNFKIAAWDWRHYTEKERGARFDLKDAEIRPFLQLENIIAAAFDTAGRLFGLTFHTVNDVPVHHADVRVWEVRDREHAHVGVFMGDYFARASKHSGAWMSCFRAQNKLDGNVRPIVINTMNFAKSAEGTATLLSFDDARTLFHEFGHGLHGLLSDVIYPSLSGTSVARDFVELPSQLFEHWFLQPETLKKFALHAETGEAMPDDMIDRIHSAETFNQGFASVEYLASAIADLELHQLQDTTGLDIIKFETEIMSSIGMPDNIGMRHRLAHFGHIIGGYAAGYYSYLWSEVMDADAFAAFQEAGDVFDAATADRLKTYIYSAGNVRDPEDAYIAFRGRKPAIDGLLKKRGLDG